MVRRRRRSVLATVHVVIVGYVVTRFEVGRPRVVIVGYVVTRFKAVSFCKVGY